jgi:hypothetical protein
MLSIDKFRPFMFFFLLITPCYSQADPLVDELSSREKVWEQYALTCKAGNFAFPSHQSGNNLQPCDDGDMTLFNGLLCAAGDNRGCDGVRDAQDPNTGIWHRSPRIRLLGKNDRGDADSSPDMALGIQLYLVTTRDRDRAEKWFHYMSNTYKCWPTDLLCWIKAPKFCSSDDCFVRPTDAAVLAATVDFLQNNTGMPALPDGPLRGELGTFSGYGSVIQNINASVNDAGFSQHLVGVTILLLRKLGSTDSALDSAAKTLASRNPGNAFFSWLAGDIKQKVLNDTLDRCPPDPSKLVSPLFQWQWERSNDRDPKTGLFAWQQSGLWDCIFMGKLLAQR